MIKKCDFLLSGGSTGVLLIHGLTGTPSEVRSLGRALHQYGLTVMGVQLAGHCGDIDDLLATGWQDWYQSVVDAIEQLSRQVDQVFIGGVSMGAVLALKYAQDFPDRVSGLLLYGVTFQFDGWTMSRMAPLLSASLLPMFLALNLGHRRLFYEKPPYGLKNEALRNRISQNMQSGDSSLAGLPGTPWPSINEMRKLSGVVRKNLKKVMTPCLILHAEEDDITDARNATMVSRQINAPSQLFLLKNSYHLITIDNDRKIVVDHSIKFIQEYSMVQV